MEIKVKETRDMEIKVMEIKDMEIKDSEEIDMEEKKVKVMMNMMNFLITYQKNNFL